MVGHQWYFGVDTSLCRWRTTRKVQWIIMILGRFGKSFSGCPRSGLLPLRRRPRPARPCRHARAP
ncbi:hypothetical protein KPATCC21470_7577 [Kitasatospora purpeofusca]